MMELHVVTSANQQKEYLEPKKKLTPIYEVHDDQKQLNFRININMKFEIKTKGKQQFGSKKLYMKQKNSKKIGKNILM